jgi:hypothetical protein
MLQRKIPAVYMRGGTSKGVFFRADAVPADPAGRDALLLRVLGSPDPYGKQVDGMGGATSSTSKVVLVGPSSRDDCDLDYLFGAVDIHRPVIDWSGNCGNLTSAVAPFAIREGLVPAPANGIAQVRIWQANIGKRIVARVPMRDGEVVELGDFHLDGVTFPAAEIVLDFLDPADAAGGLFPTGRALERVDIPGLGAVEVTLINAGNPHIFIAAESLGLTGAELPDAINGDAELLRRCEQIRAHCTVLMGLAGSAEEATRLRPHTPKLAWVSRPQPYPGAGGKPVAAADIDLTARILSMGKAHHAMTGTGGVALAAAAGVEGTLVQRLTDQLVIGGQPLRIGHPSGVMAVGATVRPRGTDWTVEKVTMSRSARRLMEGWVLA